MASTRASRARLVYRRQVEEEIVRSQPISDHVQDIARGIALDAKSLARVEAYASGDYYRSIEAGAGVRDGRAVGRVSAGDFKAGWIEFGTRRQPPKAILRRAAEAAGVSFMRNR